MRLKLVFAALALSAAEARAQSVPLPGVAVFRGEYSTVILRAPASALDEGLGRRLADVVQRCRSALPISAADSAAVVAPPVVPGRAVGAAGTWIEITIIANASELAPCGDDLGVTSLLGLRGVWPSADAVPAERVSVQDVRVLVAGEPLDASAHERVPLRALSGAGLQTSTLALQRVAVPVAALTPRAEGRPAVTVRVSLAAGGGDDTIVIPWEVVRDLWQPVLVARVGAFTAQVPLVDLPSPSDRGFAEVAAALERGRAEPRAIAGVTAQAHAFGLSRADRTWARAQSALALAAAHDTLGVQFTMAALLAEEPCFRWGADAPPALREATQGLVPAGPRCSDAPLWLVAARATVAPGFGRPALGDGGDNRRWLVASVVVGGMVLSQFGYQGARDKYADYLAAQIAPLGPIGTQPDVPSLYFRADNQRMRARSLELGALGLWLGYGAYSVWAERRFAARLQETRAVGVTPRRVGWRRAIQVSPTGFRLGVEGSW